MPMPTHNRYPALANARRAFTLIELLIVITLIGVLMGVGIFALKGASQNVKEKATKTRMALVEDALTLYQTNYDAYPPQLVFLLSPTAPNGVPEGQGFLKEDGNLDSWGRELEYYTPFENWDWLLISAGADGRFETADDIEYYPSE